MKKTLLLSILGLGMASMLQAQVYISEEMPMPNFTSVTNEGVAVGFEDQNCPFYTWDPYTNTYTYIGGMSSGQGVGGNPSFSDDGKLIAGPMPSDEISLSVDWTKTVYDTFADFKFHQFSKVSDYMLFAVGGSSNGEAGIILKSTNNGVTWKRADQLSRQKDDGTWENYTPESRVLAISPMSNWQIWAGGEDGLLVLGRGNGYWDNKVPMVNDEATAAKAYYAIDFIPVLDAYGSISSTNATYGCFGVQQADDTYAVWYTSDSGATFSVATGVAGKPISITHVGEVFYLATENGHIQKSTDYGATWSDIFSDTDGRMLYRLMFADENNGIALSDNVVYITSDGGDTWELRTVLPASIGIGWAKTSSWQDVAWNDDVITVVGTNGCCYRSYDKGTTFTELKIDPDFEGEYGAIFFDPNTLAYIVWAEGGNSYRQVGLDRVFGYCAGIYNLETEEWTPLASSGYLSGESASAPYRMSGDGKNVVGLAYYLDTATETPVTIAYATVWNDEKGMIKLDNKFEDRGRACRANAASYDGSVVVGWQDIFGPWYGTIWRKNASGTYDRMMLTLNADKTEADIDYNSKQECYDNLIGYCQSVSADGKYVGGRGGANTDAVTGPWIWNEEEGVKVLIDGYDGTTADINNDGTKAIGWLGLGSSAWLWTKEDGVKYLNDYVRDVLQQDLGDFFIMSVYDMSANGRYLTGYGMMDGNPYGYVMDLYGDTSNIADAAMKQVKAAVYPNPVADELHVDLPYTAKEVKTGLTLVNMQGMTVYSNTADGQSNVIDVKGLAEGIYILNVNAQGTSKSFKVIVKH
ncbi:MAG: T9SS type A sorting domain-containing protein [Lepagella sp.]